MVSSYELCCRLFWDESSLNEYNKSLNHVGILRYKRLFSHDFIPCAGSTGEYWDEIGVTTFPASILKPRLFPSRPAYIERGREVFL